MNIYQITELFKEEMNKQGITPPLEICVDGQLHRFHIEGDKKSSKNGWYVFYADAVPCGGSKCRVKKMRKNRRGQ